MGLWQHLGGRETESLRVVKPTILNSATVQIDASPPAGAHSFECCLAQPSDAHGALPLSERRTSTTPAQTCDTSAATLVAAEPIPSTRSCRHKGQLLETCNQPPKQSAWKT
mmetsp:Transcript_114875/g.336028  ORF Transcript_114875/g.336028 Transcript_114875/m.336028 type:complete len:111 (-) Transcript_114875:843-1175(-)